ncbi:hypothetical protein M3Y99_01624700 [Aphelenchoides fujianensis]|nr:hypothetical protein M3Y99_01624700 [Aphelenchoides fujianensis]
MVFSGLKNRLLRLVDNVEIRLKLAVPVLKFNWTPLVRKHFELPKSTFFVKKVDRLLFVDERTVVFSIAPLYEEGGQTFLVLSFLDLRAATLVTSDYVQMPARVDQLARLYSAERKAVVCFSAGRNGAPNRLQTVEIVGGRLELREDAQLPAFLRFKSALVGGEKILGFQYNNLFPEFDPTEMIEFSPESGRTVEHAIAMDEELEDAFDDLVKYTWADGRFFVAINSDEGRATAVHVFDPRTKKWEDAGIRLGAYVCPMLTAADGTLLVRTVEPSFNNSFYRFYVNRPKSLLEAAWSAVRRRDQFCPGFAARVLRALPPNSPLRCPWAKDHLLPADVPK